MNLVDELKNTKWNGALAKFYKAKYNRSIKGPEAKKRQEKAYNFIHQGHLRRIGDQTCRCQILAGDVGYLYFRGEKYAISLDELDKLRLKGTDVVIIEKQGIAEVLKYHSSAPYGIALLTTRGFLTENALDLSAFAETRRQCCNTN